MLFSSVRTFTFIRVFMQKSNTTFFSFLKEMCQSQPEIAMSISLACNLMKLIEVSEVNRTRLETCVRMSIDKIYI